MKIICHIPIEITLSTNITKEQIENLDIAIFNAMLKEQVVESIRANYKGLDQVNLNVKTFILEK